LSGESRQKCYQDFFGGGGLYLATYMLRILRLKPSDLVVQINAENVQSVRNLMDEVFGSENFVSQITFRKTNRALGSKLLGNVSDNLIWYGKNKNNLTFREILIEKDLLENISNFQWIGEF
jgi:adenine-specific DNA-methyltransferase